MEAILQAKTGRIHGCTRTLRRKVRFLLHCGRRPYMAQTASSRQRSATPAMEGILLQKTKVARPLFFAKIRNGKRSPIRITSIALPKSPVSLTRGDEVPHIFTRKPRLKPAEFLVTTAKRLLQHNPLKADAPLHGRKAALRDARRAPK